MGTFRFWLAVCVVIFHTAPLPIKVLDSFLAVITFFLLSGFYMNLVLEEKYNVVKRGWRQFYKNRALRIYPLYWLTLLLTVILCATILHDQSFNPLLHNSYLSISSVIHNLTLIGSFDSINPYATPIPFIVLQAWTLQVEGMFYLVVPWISQLSWVWLLIMIGCSFISRTLTYNYHIFGIDSVDHRFFPNQLIFFVLGMLSYQIYKKIKTKKVQPIVFKIVSIAVAGITILQPYLAQVVPVKIAFWGFLCLCLIMIPFLFITTKNSQVDVFFGKMAYPMYLVHIPFAWSLKSLLDPTLHTHALYPVSTLTISLVISATVVVLLDPLVDKYKSIHS